MNFRSALLTPSLRGAFMPCGPELATARRARNWFATSAPPKQHREQQVDTIRLLLATHKDEIVDDLWHVVEEGPNQLLQAASALAFYDADDDAKWLVVQKWLSILTTICPVDRAACVRGWTRLQPSAIFGAVQRSPLCWRND